MCGVGLTLVCSCLDGAPISNAPSTLVHADDVAAASASAAAFDGTAATNPNAAPNLNSNGARSRYSKFASIMEQTLQRRGPDSQRSSLVRPIQRTVNGATAASGVAAVLTGTVLHLRGPSAHVTAQPLVHAASGNILCWNGEVYSVDYQKLKPAEYFPQPIPVLDRDQNDTAYILDLISALPLATFIPAFTSLMAAIDGPFSFVLYHAPTNCIWYGRDKMGRRSLVASQRYSPGDGHIVQIASLIPRGEEEGDVETLRWEEVSTTGLWCVEFHANQDADGGTGSSPASDSASASLPVSVPCSSFTLLHSPYPHIAAACGLEAVADLRHLPRAISVATGIESNVAPYTRRDVMPLDEIDAKARSLDLPSPFRELPSASQLLYAGLKASIAKRVELLCTPSSPSHARIGILFSGGIDCMVMAALAHKILPPNEPIDLINVGFCGEIKQASILKYVPDRITAINGWRELRAIAIHDANGTGRSPRTWNLIQVNVTMKMLERNRERILALLQPNCTVMDFNIASVLWFGTMGRGLLYQESDDFEQKHTVSRLSRLGELKNGKDQGGTTSVGTAGDSIHRQQRETGRVLPPELMEKIVQLYHQHCLELKANEIEAGDEGQENESRPMIDDDTSVLLPSSPSPSPSPSDSPTVSTGSKSKSDRRMIKHLERKMVRSYFKKMNRKQQEEEQEDILPSKEDFLDLNAPEEEPEVTYDDSSIPFSSSPSSSPLLPVSSPFFTSSAKVLLIGIGADEQLAGYGRHRTVWMKSGVDGLALELAKDFERIWRRNLGRDDRIVSDSSREARHPFLDEQLVALIHRLPLEVVADFQLPPGIGDKRILRQVAQALGLEQASKLVKRAMQFGSRIANKKVAGYVAMDSSITLREIVNPFLLRSTVNGSTTNSSSSAYNSTTPQSKLHKKVQRARGKPGFE